MSTIQTFPSYEERNRRRSAIITAVLYAMLLLLLFLPLLTYPTPPLGQEGILVRLGTPDVGNNSEPAAASAEVAPAPEIAAAPTKPLEAVTPAEITPPPPVPTPEVVEQVAPEPQPDPEVIRAQQAAIVLAAERAAKDRERTRDVERKRVAAAEAKAIADAEAAKKAAAAAEKRRVAEAAAAKQAAEKRAAALRAGTADLFSSGTGTGSGAGNNKTPGDSGDPNGNPDRGSLEGLSTGAGSVGGGLQSRGVVSSPKLNDQSQRAGRIVVKVCVGADGKVQSADYTQKGSSSSDAVLVKTAVDNARSYRFSESSAGSQCGQITYDFVLK